jgi:hypothetical protein
VRRLALIALLAAACSPARTSAPADSLTLAFHKGDTYSYSFQLTAHETLDKVADTLEETAHLTYTVRSVDSGGTADISLATTDVVITSTVDQVTAPMGAPSNTTIEMKVAADGRVLSEALSGYGSGTGGSINWGVLAGRAVKPGDTWSKDYDTALSGAMGSNHFVTTSRYLRDETFQGARAAVIETTIINTANVTTVAATPGDVTAAGKGTTNGIVTTWVDRDGHRILKSHLTATYDETATFDAPSMPPPTVVSIKGNETSDMLPA